MPSVGRWLRLRQRPLGVTIAQLTPKLGRAHRVPLAPPERAPLSGAALSASRAPTDSAARWSITQLVFTMWISALCFLSTGKMLFLMCFLWEAVTASRSAVVFGERKHVGLYLGLCSLFELIEQCSYNPGGFWSKAAGKLCKHMQNIVCRIA